MNLKKCFTAGTDPIKFINIINQIRRFKYYGFMTWLSILLLPLAQYPFHVNFSIMTWYFLFSFWLITSLLAVIYNQGAQRVLGILALAVVLLSFSKLMDLG